MKSRTTVTIILALVSIVLVMGVAVLMTFTGIVKAEKFDIKQSISLPAPGALYIKLIDLTGDGEKDLFVQSERAFQVLDGNGNELFSQSFNGIIQFTFNDLDGDNVNDIVIYYNQGAQSYIVVYSKGTEIINFAFENSNEAARVAVIPSTSGPEFITGDDEGVVTAFSLAGEELWQERLGGFDPTRGMEDATIQGSKIAVVASEGGNVVAFSPDGTVLWEYELSERLRHLRAYDLDGDGTTEIFIGGDVTKLVELDGASGQEKLNNSMGQPVTRVGEAELNGDPSQREFYVGGKDGGVWAFTADGNKMWGHTVNYKVTAIDNFDVENDGKEEIFIGDEGGDVNIFYGEGGSKQGIVFGTNEIVRMDNSKVGDRRQLEVADNQSVRGFDIDFQSATSIFRFTPLVVGLIISAIIIVVAWLIASIPPKPTLQVTVSDESAEGLQSRRRMLKESIADVERVKNAGEIEPSAYLARLKDLRGQLAETEAALLKAGVSIKPEMFQCPHCGGTLPLGRDKCDYCGQVVIT